MVKKKLMIVAGGAWQVPIVLTAREMGLHVLNTNLYPDSPGFQHAHESLVADVLDREKHLVYARDRQPEGIVTDQSDIAVTTVAYLAEQLGLPGIGSAAAQLFTSKHLMRQSLSKLGFPCPEFLLCRSLSEARRFAKSMDYSVVLKPLANQSSRGVFRIESEHQLRECYPKTLAFSSGGQILVEEFLDGPEFTVEGIKLNDHHHTLAISTKSHLPHNPMVASDLFYSPISDQHDFEILEQQHNALVEQMGLPFGITHAEYIHCKGRFYLVEIAARGGGTKISSHIVPCLSGVPTNALLIRRCLGEKVAVERNRSSRKYGLLSFFNFDPGVVSSTYGVDEVKSWNGVLDIAMNFNRGDLLAPPSDDRARHGHFIIVGESAREITGLAERIRSHVGVNYDPHPHI